MNTSELVQPRHLDRKGGLAQRWRSGKRKPLSGCGRSVLLIRVGVACQLEVGVDRQSGIALGDSLDGGRQRRRGCLGHLEHHGAAVWSVPPDGAASYWKLRVQRNAQVCGSALLIARAFRW